MSLPQNDPQGNSSQFDREAHIRAANVQAARFSLKTLQQARLKEWDQDELAEFYAATKAHRDNPDASPEEIRIYRDMLVILSIYLEPEQEEVEEVEEEPEPEYEADAPTPQAREKTWHQENHHLKRSPWNVAYPPFLVPLVYSCCRTRVLGHLSNHPIACPLCGQVARLGEDTPCL